MIIEANQEMVTNYMAKSDKVVVIKFWAEWCGPCKVLGPIVDEVEKMVDADFLSVNADDNSELVQKFGIRGIPTMLFAYKGTIHKTLVGVQSREQILSTLIEVTAQ